MKRVNRNSQSGFSLIELMIVLLIATVFGGLIFSQINVVQQTATNEDQKLDLFQETRDFMDQMSRDLHQAGYPNLHNFAPTQLDTTTCSSGTPSDATACDMHVAVGLVKVATDELWFEGDVDGTGTVSVVDYKLYTSGTNCPCLRRSQVAKITADPLSGQGSPVYYTEITGVQNTSIFQAFHSDNSSVTLPVDFENNATDIGQINQIQVTVTAQSNYIDPRTKVKPSATMVSTVRLNNCSQATTGLSMTCQ